MAAANFGGFAVYAGKEAVRATTAVLTKMSPQQLNSLASTVTAGASNLNQAASQKVSTALNAAATKDRVGRNALFFALLQHPSYLNITAAINSG
jgi:hypothetical protein